MTAPTYAHSTRFGRVYRIPGYNVDLPSVTTVIKQMAAPALEKWKRAQVAKAAIEGHDWRNKDSETAEEMILAAANSFTRRAALRGSQIHDIIDSGNTDYPPEYGGYIAAAAEIISTLGELWASELTLVNTLEGYAGTADALTWTTTPDNTLTVLDWKTVANGKNVGWSNHALQLAALAKCDSYVDEDGRLQDLPPIDTLRIVGLRPDGTYDSKHQTDPIRIGQAYETFLGLLEAHTFTTTYPFLTYWEKP